MFCASLFDVRLPEDDLKKIETCRNLSELYVKVYVFYYMSLRWYDLLNCTTQDIPRTADISFINGQILLIITQPWDRITEYVRFRSEVMRE